MSVTYFKFILISGVLALSACAPSQKTIDEKPDSTANVTSSMQKELFGVLPDGQQVFKHVLRNKNGVEMHVINYGAIITHLKTPDRTGIFEDIVLGYDSLDGYLSKTPYFGAV